MAPDQDKAAVDRQGGDAANTAKRLSIAVAMLRMFALDPSTRASVASLILIATTGIFARSLPFLSTGR